MNLPFEIQLTYCLKIKFPENFWNFQTLIYTRAHTHCPLLPTGSSSCIRVVLKTAGETKEMDWILEQKEAINGKTDEIQVKSGIYLVVTGQSWFLVSTNVP